MFSLTFSALYNSLTLTGLLLGNNLVNLFSASIILRSKIFYIYLYQKYIEFLVFKWAFFLRSTKFRRKKTELLKRIFSEFINLIIDYNLENCQSVLIYFDKNLLKVMEKIESYFDWELKKRKKSKVSINRKDIGQKVNSLGISNYEFKRFLEDWKARNVSKDE